METPQLDPKILDGVRVEPRPYQARIVGKALRMFAGQFVNAHGHTEPAARSVMIESPTGCLTGDTLVGFNVRSKAFVQSLHSAFVHFRGSDPDSPPGFCLCGCGSRTRIPDKTNRTKGQVAGVPLQFIYGHQRRHVRWMDPIYVRAYRGERGIGLQPVHSIVRSGIRRVFELSLIDGKTLRGTVNHPILTVDGWCPLGDLEPGDLVLTDVRSPIGTSLPRSPKKDYGWVSNLWNHPYGRRTRTNKMKCGFTIRVPRHVVSWEAHANGLSVEEYVEIMRHGDPSDLILVDPAVYVVHHKDRDHTNNDPENLEVMTALEHHRLHGREENYQNFGNAIPRPVEVLRVEERGDEMTYDICCEQPYHTFVANGIVVHNSGKTVMALLTARALQQAHPGLRVGWAAMRRNLLAQATAENEARGFGVAMRTISMFDKHPPAVDLLVVDEAQHDAAASMTAMHAFIKPRFVLGLSVGPRSVIHVSGPNGEEVREIGEFCDGLGAVDGRHVPLHGYKVRAFDGQRFVWRDIVSFYRHEPGDKRIYKIKTELGRILTITEDHSVYVVDGSELVEKRGSELRLGDQLLLEEEIPAPSETTDSVDISKYMMHGDWRAASTDFADFIEHHIREENGYHKAKQTRYERRNGVFGPYLSANEYREFFAGTAAMLYGSGKGNWCRSHLPLESIAYLVGTYIGNGWTDAGRVCWSINRDKLDGFLIYLGTLEGLFHCNPDIRDGGGGAVEVRVGNVYLASYLRAAVGSDAPHKRLPSDFLDWSNRNLRAMLQGLIDTDGCISARKDRGGDLQSCRIVTTSIRLTKQLLVLFKRFGVLPAIYTQPPGLGGVIDGRQIVGRWRRYDISFSTRALAGDHSHVRRGLNLPFAGRPVRIAGINESAVSHVYDLSVNSKDWQCFVANGFLVHNTATPYRTDRVKLCFDKVITDAGIHALIQDGYLSRYRHFTIPEFSPAAVAAAYARERKRWGRSLVFFHNLRDAGECCAALLATGVRAEVVSAASDREKQLADFAAGETDVLLSMMILTEGFDCPSLQTVFCRPSGKGCTVQMCGRVFRKHPDLPMKQIVQCRNTRHPFLRTAHAEEQYTWEGGRWQALTMNKEIDAVTQTARGMIARVNVELPKLLKVNRTRRIPNRRNRED